MPKRTITRVTVGKFRTTTRTGLRGDGMPLLAIVGPKLTFFGNL